MKDAATEMDHYERRCTRGSRAGSVDLGRGVGDSVTEVHDGLIRDAVFENVASRAYGWAMVLGRLTAV